MGIILLLRRAPRDAVAAAALLVLILGATTGVHSPAGVQPPAGSPNVLMVVWDVARAQDLSLFGYGRLTDEQLVRLAARGVVFERATAPPPWTLPSHASFFMGREPHELSADFGVPLDGRFPTLAEYPQCDSVLRPGARLLAVR